MNKSTFADNVVENPAGEGEVGITATPEATNEINENLEQTAQMMRKSAKVVGVGAAVFVGMMLIGTALGDD